MRRLDRYTCEEMFRKLNDYLDRELSAGEIRLVEEHLEDCANCIAEYKFEAGMLREIKSKVRGFKAPRSVLSKISERLAEAEKEDRKG